MAAGCRINTSQTLYKGREGRPIGVQSRLLPWSKAGQSLIVVWERGDAQPATSRAGASVERHSPSTHDVLATVSQIAASGERIGAEVPKKKDEVEFEGKNWQFLHAAMLCCKMRFILNQQVVQLCVV